MVGTVRVNGSEFPQHGNLYINGALRDRLIVNGVEVYKKYNGIWSGDSFAASQGLDTSGQSLRFRVGTNYGPWTTATSTISFSAGSSVYSGNGVEITSSGMRVTSSYSGASAWLPYTWDTGWPSSQVSTLYAGTPPSYYYLQGGGNLSLRFKVYSGTTWYYGAWITLQ